MNTQKVDSLLVAKEEVLNERNSVFFLPYSSHPSCSLTISSHYSFCFISNIVLVINPIPIPSDILFQWASIYMV